MSHRLILVMIYQDGTQNGLKVECPPEVAAEIERKGLKFVNVQVEKFIQGSGLSIPDDPLLKLDTFQKLDNKRKV